ncbi:hypothetical protein ACFL1G_09880 [Planctomycetota bacterium]
METKDTGNEEVTAAEKTPNNSCCEPNSDARVIPDCCKSINEPEESCSMMTKCMKGCRWFPLFPVILGIVLLMLGYFLDAEVIRIIWMITSGFVLALGILGLFIAGKMKKMSNG